MKDYNNTKRLTDLLEAFFAADCSKEELNELKEILSNIHAHDMSEEMQADIRLVKTLLSCHKNIARPENYQIALNHQLDSLKAKESRPWLRNILIPAVAAAAAIILYFSVSISHNTQGEPFFSAASELQNKISDSVIPDKPQNNKQVIAKAHRNVSAHSAPHNKQISPKSDRQTMRTLTEHYTYDDDEYLKLAYLNPDAAVVIIDNGETYVCNNMEQAPEVLAHLEEAFKILNQSDQEIEYEIDNTARDVINEIKNVNTKYGNR